MKKIYIVSSFGGQYEDKWDTNEAAFESRKDAEDYIEEKTKEYLDDDTYYEIKNYLSEQESEYTKAYIDEETCDFKEGVSEDEYYEILDEFHETIKFQLLMTKFNIDKKKWENNEHLRDFDFGGYTIIPVDFHPQQSK